VPSCVLTQLIDEITGNKRGGGDLGHVKHFYRSPIIQVEDCDGDKGKAHNNVASVETKTLVSSRRLLDTLTRKKDASMGFVTIPLPIVNKYQCALLFIDISGFTALSVSLDVESLSKAINSYFEMIVDLVISHHGDILKFAGDALFAEWRVVTQEDKDNSINGTATIDDCVLIAATCGAKVVAECSDYPVYSTTGLQIKSLNVHCGLGVGELTSVHVGNYHTRRELIVLGDPIDQVSKAEGAASLGEIVASPEALSSLRKTCHLNNMSTLTLEAPCMIACRKQQYFVPKYAEEHISRISKVFIKSFNFECMDTTALGHLQRKIALYVHPIVVLNDSSNNSLNLYRSFTPLKPNANADSERYRAEAEKRSVYTMFLKADICIDRQGDDRHEAISVVKRYHEFSNRYTGEFYGPPEAIYRR